MTQEDAAHQARIDYKRLQRLEQGVVNATMKTLVRLARVYGTSVWTMLGPAAPRRHRGA
jgi:transcriptional regulator with XRE-family HTH domain